MPRHKLKLVALLAASLAACQQGAVIDEDAVNDASVDAGEMTFFLTSVGPGDGANLGGLAGADAHCASLAAAAGAPDRIWRAYLSSTEANALDRIGEGPWQNARGVTVATSINDLLPAAATLNKATALSERGEIVNGRGDRPNRHDILTGSTPDGTTAIDSDANPLTCEDWTSSAAGSAMLGHHDRVGGGANPTHWSSAHPSRGCSQSDLRGTGGDGLFYCFAVN